MRVTIFMLLVLGALLLVWRASRAKNRAQQCPTVQYRLPERIVPEHYDLQLDVDMEALNYEGSVRVSLSVNDTRKGKHDEAVPANVIVLHAGSGLQIEQVQYRNTIRGAGKESTNDEYLDVEDVCRYAENELLVLTLAENLEHGAKGELLVSFKAPLRNDTRGFYKSTTHKQPGGGGGGELKYQAVSCFEPTYARWAFPCFDEPAMKATFDLTLVHDSRLVALANTVPVSRATKVGAGRRQLTKYKTSPLMSTYLLAFVIGEFDYVERVVFGGRLTIRAYTPVGRAKHGQFALDTAARAIALMEEYFDIPFPLEKIDMVAIAEFMSGAMENWGLITYREEKFLYDERNDPATAKGNVAETVVHELAHQWFGNLVTMKWWNDLWMNEGFAAWMATHFTHQLYPDFEWEHSYDQVNRHLEALETDSWPERTHPIRFDEIGKDIYASFDQIVYYKSNAIIRLVHDDYVGPDRFREAIRIYLKRHVHGNTEASDLWGALAEVSGLPVDEFMKSWLTQAGHPVINVTQVASNWAPFRAQKLKLEQRRHNSVLAPPDGRAKPQTWIIPIKMVLSDGQAKRETMQFVMDSQRMEVELPKWFSFGNRKHWLKLNEQLEGFYRVEYPDSLLKRLATACESKSLHVYDRLDLIDELFKRYQTNGIGLDQFLPVLQWYRNETEGVVLMTLTKVLWHLLREIPDPAKRVQIQRITLELLGAQYRRVGLSANADESSVTDAWSQRDIFSILYSLEHEPLLKDALALFDKFGNQNRPAIREIIYNSVAIRGNREQQLKLRKILEKADSKEELHRAWKAVKLMEQRQARRN